MPGAISHLQDVAPWGIENVRLSVFHPGRVLETALWETAIGSRPESINVRPNEQILQEEGNAYGNRLMLVAQNSRLDWQFSGSPPGTEPPVSGSPLTLVDVGQVESTVQKALEVSMREVRQVDRLAFGAGFVRTAANELEGSMQLSAFLPFIGSEQQVGSDFIYQVNRRRRSLTVPHVSINRIARWSLGQHIVGTLQFGPSAPPNISTTAAQLVSKLNVDINSDPRSSAVSLDKMADLLDEFIELAHEIATEGDVP